MTEARFPLKDRRGRRRLKKGFERGRRTDVETSSHAACVPCRGWYRPGNWLACGMRSLGSDMVSTRRSLSIPRRCSRGSVSMIFSICAMVLRGSVAVEVFSILIAISFLFTLG